MTIIYWNQEYKDVEEYLKTDISKGLSNEEAQKRLREYGYNQLKEQNKKSLFLMFLDQFKDFMVLILLAATIISLLLGEVTDAVIMIVVVVLNGILGMLQENRAEKSLEALKKLTSPTARVIRSGKVVDIPTSQLVPGDIVYLEAGNFVPADGRLFEATNLRIDESALTGESVPVDKDIKALKAEELPLGDRINMAYMGTVVAYGRGRMIVTDTGMNTEMGKIAEFIDSQDTAATPLQRRLEELGKYLGVGVLLICFIIFITGILSRRPVFDMFMTAVSLAVAAIPEGLPAIVTITLAIGVQKMIKKKAIIRKLPAVETLGSASVICTDKTGTLTQNRMTVMKLYTNDKVYSDINGIFKSEGSTDNEVKFLLECAALCTDAFIDEDGREIGDPTEVAIVMAAKSAGIRKQDIEEIKPRVDEVPFDSDRKMMTTVHRDEKGYKVITKGAPDNVIDRCTSLYLNGDILPLYDSIKEKIKAVNEEMAKGALRVLAVAYKDLDDIESQGEFEYDLTFIGLIGMIDPPREEVKESVRLCKKAGIKPVMITGDHLVTAVAIGKELGIYNAGDEAVTGVQLNELTDEELDKQVKNISVYARVSPEHKVRIVKAWQNNGAVVAMTGDGVNDAPALKQADIGAAMGMTGTDVAKGAADMILTDDNFATIVSAVQEGRTIYENIRKSIHFLLSCNVGEIVVIFVAVMLGMPMPLKPIHILWINLLTDSFPALALGVEPPAPDVMDKKPRPKGESIFAHGLWWKITLQGILIGLLTLVAFRLGLMKNNLITARTMAFSTLVLTQLFQALNVRAETSLLKIGLFSNRYMTYSIILSAVLMFIVVLTPLRTYFGVSVLNATDWGIVFILSLSILIITEVIKYFKKP